MDPKGVELLPDQRMDKEVDIVSMVKIKILVTAKRDTFPLRTEEVSSTKIQVRRSDTIATITTSIRADNTVDEEADRFRTPEAPPAVYESVKFTQGGIVIRGTQTAALLFEDRRSNVSEAEVTYLYYYPPPTVAKLNIRASVVVEGEGSDEKREGLADASSMEVACSMTIGEIAQRVREEFAADSRAEAMGGENFMSAKVVLGGSSYQGAKVALPRDAVKAYFTDPYSNKLDLNVSIIYSMKPSPACCTVA